MTEAERLNGKSAVAMRLSISLSTVDRLLASGELPSIKLGRRRLVTDADLDAYIARLQAQAADQVAG